MKIIVWNVNDATNTSRGNPPSYQKAFTETYSLAARWKDIRQTIEDQNPDIVCLLELSAASLDFVESELSGKFALVKRRQAYAPNQTPDWSLYFVIASRVPLSNIHAFAGTATPLIPLTQETRACDSVLRGVEETFERTFLVAEFTHDDSPHVLALAHLGLRYEYQQVCVDMFTQYLREKYLEHKIIVCGDFNTFPNESGYEMRTLKSFEDLGMQELVRDRNTFCGYPSDIGILHTQEQRDNVTMLCAAAADTDDLPAIRALCVKTIMANRGKLIVGGLDRVLTNIPDAAVEVLFNVPTVEEFTTQAVAGTPHNSSDHACIVISVQQRN